MPVSPASNTGNRSRSIDLPLVLGLIAALVFFIGSGAVSCYNASFLRGDADQVAQTHNTINSLENVVSLMKDAETGQRGFLITGDEAYLEPFTAARAGIDEQINRALSLIGNNPAQQALMAAVKSHVAAKFAELDETIALRRTTGFDAARAVVVTDRGKKEMDALRAAVSQVEEIEIDLRNRRVAEMQEAYRVAIISGILTALAGIILSIVITSQIRRTAASRSRQEWLQNGRLGLSGAMFGEQRVEELGSGILDFLVKYMGAHAGAFFVGNGSEFKRVAAWGVPADSATPKQFRHGDGLLGQASVGKTAILIDDVPEGYLTVGCGLGQSKPRYLVIAPANSDGMVNAVLELGFLHPLSGPGLELLNQGCESIGVAVKSANYRSNLQDLLEETQRQAEELQTQSEELRVSNEELEEGSRALTESQTRLELQQAELEQTNSQLEEQTRLLEIQRNDLSRAQIAVQAKVDELEQASRYKSDFLANMSHELRTPLNSLLILSRLLSENPGGNLTDEQVRHAQTIESSGNDLLTLISDILDLSKIEAGHMEIHAEPVPVAGLFRDLSRLFEPIARQKGLKFEASIAADCPAMIDTDRQRVEQVLKNLLSNALKFTEKGGVEVSVSRVREGTLAFVVSDTGIGISTENQSAIFNAFHQADSTISRRYGGTGLGLSISRELARLLGGTIGLKSEPGQGSAFTLLLPETFGTATIQAPSPAQIRETQPKSPSHPAPQDFPVERRSLVADDRDTLVPGIPSILVIEDDESFARILRDVVREADFQCLIASTADEALSMTRQYYPSAVLLDVGLPDNSGLSVLDRLKQDIKTRHIPIHVVSAGDHSQTAYFLGAAGYMIKPVRREELVDALKQLKERLAGGMRRVLIVEDDAVQQESLIRLLGTQNVEAVAVGTAAECLARLKDSSFDCMVLDLSLPDASGYSLLETLSREDAYSFPPVIVYTGRELSHDEEQKMRRYSKSIIIKGAKSPERLLDEVTLFLHQVVSEMPPEQQRMLKRAHNRDAILEGRRILIVEDDVRNVYALSNILEPRGAVVQIARNGREAIEVLEKSQASGSGKIDLVLMDVMMPEMDGLTATREIRRQPEFGKLPIVMLTAKAMQNDHDRCIDAGANDYMAKPLDVEKLLSLVRVWMPRQ